MDLTGFIQYKQNIKRRKLRAAAILIAAALAMAFVWYASGASLSASEERLYSRVTRAHESAVRFKAERGIPVSKENDPNSSGLIGIEWSPITTTLGALEAKRTAADPRWSIIVWRWLERLDIKRGDNVVVLSSSSFPGMMLNVLAALEERGADVTLFVSLGSSTFGANDPRAMWSDLAAALRREGLLHTRAAFYTYGGGGDVGGAISGEGRALMRAAAKRDGVPLVEKKNLAEMTAWKASMIKKTAPKLVISVGGSHSSMGSDDAVLKLEPGLHMTPGPNDGNGLIGISLRAGYPVVHLLNIKELSAQNHIPFDAPPSPFLYGSRSLLLSALGLLIFAAALVFYPANRGD